MAALDAVGWVQPITLNTVTGHLLDGHMRVLLALRHGEATVPVIYVQLTPEEEKQALLYLYQTGAYGAVDRDLLRDALEEARVAAGNLLQQPGIQQMFSDLSKVAKKALPLPPEPPLLQPHGGPNDDGEPDDREPLFTNSDARPVAQQQRVAPEPQYSGRGTVALTERDYGPERFALSVVLTKADKRRWDALKEALQVKSDSQAVVAILDKLESGELALAT